MRLLTKAGNDLLNCKRLQDYELKRLQYELGREHCKEGNKPFSINEHYLKGYSDQYELEQKMTALGGDL